MKYRTLGKTGMKVSVIGLGTWQFGGEWGIDYKQEEVDAIFDTAREVGINLIDTAECYGDHLSEKFIGKAIKQDREKWILATKFGHHFKGNFDRDVIYEPELVKKQLEDSLEALQTDYVDLYQFHSGPDEVFLTNGLWEYLEEEVERGRIKHLGISIGANTNLFQTEKASELNAETIQLIYNRLSTEPEELVLPSCKEQNLGVLARVPLASGFLSGKYTKDSVFPENDVREAVYKDQRFDLIERAIKIKETEVPADVNMAEWALAWCLKNEVVSCVIPGCKNPDQVRSNANASTLVSEDHPQACLK